ncbi:M14 family zinc carboxypeptidase, partial [Natronomonas sp.]|uniref:M14 family zinc carboxypeptidase n=1 Tax=Natronomonas sp. TaxID=2184060 RepID=UPI002FC32727
TGAALTLPANATADASAPEYTTEYQYVLNHTPEDHPVPTLVRFSDPSGPTAMESALDEEVHTTTPEPAAYTQVTTTEANTVADIPSASEFQFAPGSNPFWRIGYYPAGVFPEPRRSVDYIGFEQLKDGPDVLEECYPDRIRVKNVGQSPGHHNNVTDRPDPKGMYVAELTNFDSETDFEDKEKVFFSCSLHGLEMAGRETGARVLENAARGSEPDVAGSDAKLEPLLDDVVVIIGFTNPDGWAVRNPQYDSGWQVGGPGTGTPRAPAAPLYERGNAEVFDTNRQYPAVGYITPAHYPAAPANYDDQPGYVDEKVPDAKAFVDYFQDYENLNYGADLHGGPVFNNFVLGLISQDQFNTRELHEVYEMCLNINETLAEALDTWQTAGETRVQLVGDQQFDPVLFGVVPESAFDYATIYDTIGYTVSGAFLDWMAHPEPIGLDMTTLDFEMSFNHMLGGNVYNPELFEMEVTGYRAAIRTITEAEDSGRGIHYISSLLPPAWQGNLHPFGLQNYTVTFLGNVLFTSALGFKQVREAGETTREYGRVEDWETGDDDVVDGLTAEGSRAVDSSVVMGEQANRVELTVSNLSDDAVIRDQFPPDWTLLPFGNGTEVEDGVVEFRDVEADEVDGSDESVTFTYFVDPPNGIDNSNLANYGPAIADIDGETVDFAGEDDVVYVGAGI